MNGAMVNENQALYADFRVGLPVRVKQALRLYRGSQIGAALDIGCADGAFLEQLRAARKYGIDIASNRHRPADVHVVRMDVAVEPLPFEADYFDAVYAGEILEHLLDTERFLREVARVLKPTGLFVLTTPNLCSLKNLYCWLRGRQLAWVDYKNGQFGHLRYFSPQSIRVLLAEAGFVLERICSSGFEVGAHVPWLGWLSPITRWIFAHSVRGNCLIVAARKRAAGNGDRP
jgi:2-polyprenyl-3-methyl-5-hydroxy-6-metoxy-1,4-benzoquinol methylase